MTAVVSYEGLDFLDSDLDSTFANLILSMYNNDRVDFKTKCSRTRAR